MPQPLLTTFLGRVGYSEAQTLQDNLVAARCDDRLEDQLLLLEHPPVITFGHREGIRHLLVDRADLKQQGIELVETDRGGDITYHGPGQLIGYLIVKLQGDERNIPWLFQTIENSICDMLLSHGIRAGGGTRQPGPGLPRQQALTQAGVWVGEDKLCALGMKLHRWVTKHGFALNVDPNLLHFQNIIACGLENRGVTSMAKLGASTPSLEELSQQVGAYLAEGLGRTHRWQTTSLLDSFFSPYL